MDAISLNNNQSVAVKSIPVIPYGKFRENILEMMKDHPERHCIQYFGFRMNGLIRLFCCIADDTLHSILVCSSETAAGKAIEALSAQNLNFEKFERELAENFGISYSDHPWLKQVRFPGYTMMKDYPFFSTASEELHEVGVGPVHAGIIEPGHFRFICNGEQILHLEIQLGYQHRGIENLFLEKKMLLQRTILSESIAGDSVIEHTTAFSAIMESLSGITLNDEASFSRTVAQELERTAIHTGDLSALCTDVGYQLGSAVLGRLRTPLINYFQEWCGNRLAKGLVRPGFNPYPMNRKLADRLLEVLGAFEPDFTEINSEISRLPSTLSRFERTGALNYEQLLAIGTVGMSARMSALERDIRKSHPYAFYSLLDHTPVIKHHGDVYSRVQIRKEEVLQSISYIRELLKAIPKQNSFEHNVTPKPGLFAVSLTEGWRGETSHAAITDDEGELLVYKVKDPSFHNWLALALAVRNNEISDFPVCNKSFNLSYCGHDL
jgi:Ni,Fe-hydrogenase III large subunit